MKEAREKSPSQGQRLTMLLLLVGQEQRQSDNIIVTQYFAKLIDEILRASK